MAGANVADNYADVLRRLADAGIETLLELWDSLDRHNLAASTVFHDAAQPVLVSIAQAAVEASIGVGEAIGATGAPSDLIVADAAARAFEPFDRIGSALKQTIDYSDAVAQGRQVVQAIAHDAVYSSGRQAIAEIAFDDFPVWQRRVTGRSCDWCLSKASIEFPTAAAATFGHDNCDCTVFPIEMVAEHNSAILAERGFDPKSAGQYSQRQQLKKSVRTAKKRQAQAKADQRTEPDPARRERLSIREQEWETRAERAQERLSHLG